MTNPYLHACTDCGIVHNELDTDVHGKDLLIFDDGGWFCRDCWKEMDKKRDAEFAKLDGRKACEIATKAEPLVRAFVGGEL